MQVHEKLVVGLRSYASLRLVTQILSWIGTIYVIRRVGSHALGQYAVALVVFSYLAMTYDGTLLETLVQRPPSSENRRAVFSLVTGIGLLLAAAVIVLSGPLGRLVHDPAVPALVIAAAGAFFLMSFGVLPQAGLAQRMAFPRLATIAAIQSLCVTLTSVVLATLGAGAWALAWGLIAGALIRSVLLNASSWGLMWPTVHLRKAFGYLHFGGILFADNLLWRWYTSLDTFLLGRWAGTTSLGYYNLAQQVAELPLEKISTVVNDVSLPAFAQLREEEGAAAHLLLETIRTHATAGFALFWGLAAVAAYAVPVLFGNQWNFAIFPLIALSAVAPVRLMGSIETPAMTGIGRPGVLLRTKLVIAPCMTVALLVACRFWGIRGAALTWAIVFPVCYGFVFRYVLEAAEIPYQRVLQVIRGPILGAALMVLAVLICERVLSLATPSRLIVLVVSIVIGALAYPVALRLVDPEAFRLARSRLGRFIGLRQAT